jgi:hypothetical protein
MLLTSSAANHDKNVALGLGARMPPVAGDDALVGNIIHEKAAAAGVAHDTSLQI